MTIYGESRAGKSTLAANLAAYLARYFPVMLVDLGINNVHRAASLHGVKLTPDEPGILQAWLAALDGRSLKPTVKPSAKVDGVYVMPPGPVAEDELQKYSYSAKDIFEDAAMKLHSIIINQAKIYRTPLVIIDTPPGVGPSELALAKSDMALVVVPSAGASRVFEGIMANVGNLLSERATFVVVNGEDKPINIAAPFPVYHLPYSGEVGEYSQHNHIFIMYRPGTNPGYRWQMAFSELAETVARMDQLMMDQLKGIDEIVNSARKIDELADLAIKYEQEYEEVLREIANERNEP